jgi:hypothetical protein
VQVDIVVTYHCWSEMWGELLQTSFRKDGLRKSEGSGDCGESNGTGDTTDGAILHESSQTSKLQVFGGVYSEQSSSSSFR